MYLRSIFLQNFRSYQEQKFSFSEKTTVVIGKNTAGKTNLVEAVHFLATGKTFRSGGDSTAIHEEELIGRVQGILQEDGTIQKREVTFIKPSDGNTRFSKRFLINSLPRSRNSFAGDLPLVLFHPEDLNMVIGGPNIRRNFLDSVLEQVDKEYRYATISYEKALKQRNALLKKVQETGKRSAQEFQYWDSLLIEHGNTISQKRELFINFLHTAPKEILDVSVKYDRSIINKERLMQYENSEIGAGVTLVGPQRDDFILSLTNEKLLRDFGSRGQQRLVVLQLKFLQIQYIEEIVKKRPFGITMLI